MAITQAVCSSFKRELLEGVHSFKLSGIITSHKTYQIALYTSSATLDSTTTAYSATNEVVGTGYTARGNVLTNVAPVLSGTTAFIDFADSAWAAATITARGAVIFSTTTGDPAVMVLDFGADKTSTAGTFTIQFPVADSSTAILRLA